MPVYEAPDDDTRGVKPQQGSYGVMFGGDYEWPVERQVTEAYGDTYANPDRPLNSDRRSTWFHTEMLPVAKAKRAVRAGPERYNWYNREHVVAFLDALLDYADAELVRVSFGREGSPVLYVWLAGHADDSAVEAAAKEAFGPYTIRSRGADGEVTHWEAISRPDKYTVRSQTRGTTRAGWRVPDDADGVLVRLWWD